MAANLADVDGDSLTYRWTLAGPSNSAAHLSDATAIMPTLVIDKPGPYTATLVVSDGLAFSAPASVQITTEKSAPVAEAGPNQTMHVGETVTLDASGSSDVDGDQLTFTWSFSTLPAGSLAVLSDVHAVRPTYVVDTPGSYVAQLLVSDGHLERADTVTITTVNSPPLANAGADQTVALGSVVGLVGGGSDVDHDPLTFIWSLTSKPLNSVAFLDDLNLQNPSFTADLPGVYIAQLVVNDGHVNSAPDSVVITTANSRPVADAGPDQSILSGTTVQLDGSASHDADGDQLLFRWTFTSMPSGSTASFSTRGAAKPTFVADRVGTFVAQLIVNDGNLDSAADTIVVTVRSSADAADLNISFFNPPTNPPIGSSVSHLIELRNTGPASADNVTANFKIPAGYAIVGIGPDTGTYDGSTGIWTIGSFASGSVARLYFNGTVKPTGPYDLTTSIAGSNVATRSSMTLRALTVTPNRDADLIISFFNPPTNPPIGSSVSHLIELRNTGPASADDVAASFKIPAGYAVVGIGPDTGTYDGSTGIWTIGSLASGSVARLYFTVTVKPTGPYDLTASVTGSSAPDPILANNTANATVTPNISADLNITFISAGSNPPIGSTETLWVRVRNNGPADTTGVKANFKLPAGYTIIGAPSVAGSYDPSTGDWVIGAVTSTADLLFTVSVNASGPYNLSAFITADDAPDPNPSDNSATFAVTANANADLNISFFSPPTNPPVGSGVTFFIEVRNNGPATTDNVTVNFKIPAGYTFSGGAPQVGTYNSSTGEWVIGSMTSGGLARLILGGTVNASGPYDLTTSITGTRAPDPNLADNSTSATVTPNRNADLNISFFSPPSGTIAVGSTAVVFIEVREKYGPAITTNVTAGIQFSLWLFV